MRRGLLFILVVILCIQPIAFASLDYSKYEDAWGVICEYNEIADCVRIVSKYDTDELSTSVDGGRAIVKPSIQGCGGTYGVADTYLAYLTFYYVSDSFEYIGFDSVIIIIDDKSYAFDLDTIYMFYHRIPSNVG